MLHFILRAKDSKIPPRYTVLCGRKWQRLKVAIISRGLHTTHGSKSSHMLLNQRNLIATATNQTFTNSIPATPVVNCTCKPMSFQQYLNIVVIDPVCQYVRNSSQRFELVILREEEEPRVCHLLTYLRIQPYMKHVKTTLTRAAEQVWASDWVFSLSPSCLSRSALIIQSSLKITDR